MAHEPDLRTGESGPAQCGERIPRWNGHLRDKQGVSASATSSWILHAALSRCAARYLNTCRTRACVCASLKFGCACAHACMRVRVIASNRSSPNRGDIAATWRSLQSVSPLYVASGRRGAAAGRIGIAHQTQGLSRLVGLQSVFIFRIMGQRFSPLWPWTVG